MFVAKRKRSQNFTQDEKLQFVRLLQEHGQSIITKITQHDMQTNKCKEAAWQNISEYLNANTNVKRTTDTLKKLWQKLKSDAKMYKAKARYITGTGGGPSKPMDDPVLELVVEITGRGSCGIQMVQDSDTNITMVSADAAVPNVADGPKDTIIYEEFPECEITIIDNDIAEENENTRTEIDFFKRRQPQVINEDNTMKETRKEMDWLKRRQPQLSTTNERSNLIKAKTKLNNGLATERLRVESGKSELILLQKQQMLELHAIKMENEKLKSNLLKKLISKLDTDNKEAVLPVVSVLSAMDDNNC